VVDNMRGLQAQEQESQPPGQEHGVFPLRDAPVVVYDELKYDNQSDVTDDCCDEISVTNPPAPWRAMGIPDHRNHFHSNDGNHHCHAQFDVDVHGLVWCMVVGVSIACVYLSCIVKYCVLS